MADYGVAIIPAAVLLAGMLSISSIIFNALSLETAEFLKTLALSRKRTGTGSDSVVGPCEAGVFYYRFPDQSRGHIFAITDKVFPTITGDGIHTVEELIRAERRSALLARIYIRRFASRRDEILASGEILKLVETGNHAQGCIFRDGIHLRAEALERVIDEISQGLPGFFIGRYDIRYASEEDFRQGRDFQIVELNGATSEATSIYDARNSLFSAYRTLFRQWKLVFAIGAVNQANGHTPCSIVALWRNWRQYSAAALSYPLAD